MTPEERDNARYDREFLRPGQRPWVPDDEDLEELEEPVLSAKIAALQDLTRVLRES